MKTTSKWVSRRNSPQWQSKSFQMLARLRLKRSWSSTSYSHIRKVFHSILRWALLNRKILIVSIASATTERTFSSLKKCIYTEPSSDFILKITKLLWLISISPGNNTLWQIKPTREKQTTTRKLASIRTKKPCLESSLWASSYHQMSHLKVIIIARRPTCLK